MVSDYTPSTEEVGSAYRVHGHMVDDHRYIAQGKRPLEDQEYREEFDRWLAEVERAVAEKAYERAISDLTVGGFLTETELEMFSAWHNPYRLNEGEKQ